MTPEQQAAIAKFAQTLEFSAGEFRLFLVRCNSVQWRSRLLDELEQLCSLRLQRLELRPEETRLYDCIVAATQEEPPEALMVLGLEQLTALPPLLERANQERDKFIHDLRFPVVVWMSDRIHTDLTRQASDLQSVADTLAFDVPPEFWEGAVTTIATQRFEELLQQGAARFVEPSDWERDRATQDELKAASAALTAAAPQIQAYLAFLWARVRGYRDKTAQAAYTDCLRRWPSGRDRQQLAMVHYCFGDWWRAQTRLYRREAAAAWLAAREQFAQCVQILRELGQSEPVARFLNAYGEALLATEQWATLETVAQEVVQLHQTHSNPFQQARASGF